MAAPFLFIRSRITVADVARMGFTMELISGGAPSPNVPGHAWDLRRSKSAPLRVTVGPQVVLPDSEKYFAGDGPAALNFGPCSSHPCCNAGAPASWPRPGRFCATANKNDRNRCSDTHQGCHRDGAFLRIPTDLRCFADLH